MLLISKLISQNLLRVIKAFKIILHTTPYQQGLYCDYGFLGQISKDKDCNVIESAQVNIKQLNGEQAWIMISGGKT